MSFRLHACIVLLLFTTVVESKKIGLLVMATGKYINFVPPLINSARTYFCPDHEVTFFVFTDGELESADDIVTIDQGRLGWPHDTLMRCFVYYKNKDAWADMDYVFACDADMRFVDVVGDEILGERVATQHPGYVGTKGTYETNPISRACIRYFEGEHYFAGGFHGGSCKEFEKLVGTMVKNIQSDLKKNYIAIWHDESHLNRYFVDNRPTVILNPSYCFPETLPSHYPKIMFTLPRKLIALDKNHREFQK